MPQRFLRPGITNSERFNSVSLHAQSLWLRILTRVDDFGRFNARPSVLAGELFAVWNELHPEDAVNPLRIPALCCELQRAKLADFYEIGDKHVVQLLQWEERIRVGAKEKWPANQNPQESAAFRSEILPPSPSPPPSASPPPPSSPSGNGVNSGCGMDEHGRNIPWETVEPWHKSLPQECDYTRAEVRTAWLALEANGWVIGRNQIVDWRAGLERQIQFDRERRTANSRPSSGNGGNRPDAERPYVGARHIIQDIYIEPMDPKVWRKMTVEEQNAYDANNKARLRAANPGIEIP